MVVSVATLAKLRKRNLGCRTMAKFNTNYIILKNDQNFQNIFFSKETKFLWRERERERESLKI
jgi:hypothetical protein